MSRSALIVLAVLSMAAAAYAGTTWTTPVAGGGHYQKNLATSSTSPAAPALATDGFDLSLFKAYDVVVEVDLIPNSADAAVYSHGDTGAGGAGVNTLGTSCSLLAYLYRPGRQAWMRAPTLDVDLSSSSKKLVGLAMGSFAGTAVPSGIGRMAYVPNSCNIPVKVYTVSKQ